MKNCRRGFVGGALLVLIVLLTAGAGAYMYINNESGKSADLVPTREETPVSNSARQGVEQKSAQLSTIQEIKTLLPNSIDNYSLVAANGVPVLETYSNICDTVSSQQVCAEQVWATYTNGTRTTRVIFITYTSQWSVARANYLKNAIKGRDFYVFQNKYVIWFPKNSFHVVMTRNTPSSDGLDADTSGEDVVTKYFLKSIPE